MKYKLFFSILLALALAACGASAKTPAGSSNAASASPVPTLASASSSGGGVTASGVVVADQQASLAFKQTGTVRLVQVKDGDHVTAGQTLVQLDDSTQQIQLAQATITLQELTSPAALASAQLALASDQLDLYNQQVALNSVLTQQNNQGLIDNAKAALVLAENALKDAQTFYADTPGDPNRDAPKAVAYQRLYSAQQVYDHELYIYNLYSGKANPSQVDQATAKVASAKARVAEDQTLVAVLTGATLPDHPTGTGYAALMLAKLNLQTAQEALNSTRLVAPFDGQVATVTANVGDVVSPGQVMVVLTDITHMHIETTDLSERDIPQVNPGQPVAVTVKALNQDIPGKVSVISPLSSKLGGDVVFRVILLLDELPASLLSGMSVDVRFKTGQ